MADQHRVVGQGLVEVVAVEQAAVRHDVLVVAVGLDDFALRDLVRVAVLHQFGDDAGRVLAGPGRRRVHVDLVGDGQRTDVVAVCVEKPGQQRLATEIDDAGVRALVRLLDIGARTDGHDLAAFDGQRLGARLLVVDGDDLAACIDRVGGVDLLLRGSWAACGAADSCDLPQPPSQARGQQRERG